MRSRVARFKFVPNFKIIMTNQSILSTETRSLAQRREAVRHLYPAMFRTLSAVFHNDLSRTKLLEFLHLVANRKGVTIDRTAKRSREGMLCWLCETAPELAKSPIVTVLSNTNSIEKVNVSEEAEKEKEAKEESKADTTLDFSSIGFDDDLRKEEELLLQTLC
jgi:hypothetical protein